jgi:hypothetical protein
MMTPSNNQHERKGCLPTGSSDTPEPQLTSADQIFLDDLDRKLQIIRDFTASVAMGRSKGLYLHGKGGTGKSQAVIGELQRLQVPFKLCKSRLTGRGLFDLLEAYPGEVHVLEDGQPLFRDRGAQGVPRSALGGQHRTSAGPIERVVTWTTHRMEHRFLFTGGMVMVHNQPFPPCPVLDAVKTRIDYVHLVVSDNELMALMRRAALDGYQDGADRMESLARPR